MPIKPRANYAVKGAELILTANEVNTPRWLEIRKAGLGASEASAIMGFSKYQTPLDVFLSKTTDQPEIIDEKTARIFDRGHRLEPVISDIFAELNPKLAPRRAGMFRSIDTPVMQASPDRLTADGGGLEIKTANEWVAKQFNTNTPPEHYYWQAIHSLAVTKRKRWHIAAMDVTNWNLTQWTVEASDVQDEIKALEKACIELWNCITTNTPPAFAEIPDVIPTKPDGAKTFAPDSFDAADLESLIQRRKEIEEETKEPGRELDWINDQLKTIAGNSEQVYIGDRLIYEYKTVISKRLDAKAFAKAFEAESKAFYKDSSSKRLTIKVK